MPKDYTATKVQDLLLRMKFSTPTDPVLKIDNTDPENPVTEYYAAVQILQCVAKNGTMYAPCRVERKYYGAAKAQPWTAKQVGDAMKNFSNLNTVLYNDLRAIYLNAINDDIT